MKKKILLLMLITFLFAQNVYADNKESLNTFTINIQDVPQNNSRQDNGLSDGAKAAIALGSTFGGLGILSGIGYYFYKNNKGLQSGLICGQKCPYQTVDCKTLSEILANKKQYTYLMKASEKAILNTDYHYLIIPDTEINTKTFNTIFFEVPKINNSNMNFRIIQASKVYKMDGNKPELDSDIFQNPKEKNIKKIPTYTQELNAKVGYLIKSGTIQSINNNIATITTQNSSNKDQQTYAIIVEFWTDTK